MRVRTQSLCALVAALLLVLTSELKAERFTPSVAIEAGQYAEEMTVDYGDESQSSSRSLNNTRLALGVAYPLYEDWHGLGALRGQSSLGAGLVYYVGQWPIHARQEVKLHHVLTGWLDLEVGLESGLQLNVSRLSHSYADLGLVIGVDIAGYVELLYLPAFVVGLGSDHQDVFAGTKSQRIDTGFQVLNFALRVHFDGLSW